MAARLLSRETSFFAPRDNAYVPAYRRPIGMVFQSYAIWPHLSVFENVTSPLRVGKQKVSNADVKKKFSLRSNRWSSATKSGWRPNYPGGSNSDLL